MAERITVKLVKTSALFGRFAKGAVLAVKTPADIGGEREAKIRARRMMERDHPDENQMEWDAFVEPALSEEEK